VLAIEMGNTRRPFKGAVLEKLRAAPGLALVLFDNPQ
jgi:hypothetical protein